MGAEAREGSGRPSHHRAAQVAASEELVKGEAGEEVGEEAGAPRQIPVLRGQHGVWPRPRAARGRVCRRAVCL